MKTKNVLFQVLLGCALASVSFSSYSQEEFSVDETKSAWPSPDLNQLIDDYLSQRGWVQGKNIKDDGSTFFISVGKGAISAGRSDSSFIVSRQLAFDKAMLDAKAKMLQFLELEISTELESFYSEPSQERQLAEIERKKQEGLSIEGQAAIEQTLIKDKVDNIGTPAANTLGEKANNMLRYQAAKQLQSLGFDPSKPVDQQELKPIVEQESFKKNIETVAKSRLVGMQAAKVIEFLPQNRNGQIGVITIYSERLHAIANAIFSGDPNIAPQGAPSKSLQTQIPRDPARLVSEFGVQAKRNEKGEFCLIGYGQSAPRTESTRSMQAAEDKAKMVAQGLIRQFAGEISSVLEASYQSESIDTYSDKMQDYKFDDSYEQTITSAAAALKISGIQNIKGWVATHPLTGHSVAGSVMSWCPSTALAATQMRNKQNTVPEDVRAAENKNSKSSTQKDSRRDINSDQSGVHKSESSDVGDDDF